MQAKGLLSDYQPKYNSARAVYRERKKYIDEIDWNVLAVPPSGSYKVMSFLLCVILVKMMLHFYLADYLQLQAECSLLYSCVVFFLISLAYTSALRALLT